MPTKRPATTYRSVFIDAFRVAWERKTLWVFGLFAALLSTGGAYEMTGRSFRHLTMARHIFIEMARGTFTGAETFGQFVQQGIAWDHSRMTVYASLFLGFSIVALIASVVSQGALIQGVGKRIVADADAATAGREAFWHLLWLNLLHKAAHLLLILFSSIPMYLLVAHRNDAAATVAMLTFCVMFPLTVAVSVIFMLSSVHTVRTKSHSLDAVHHALTIFRTHWLATFETGVILLGAVMLAAFGFLTSVAVASIPFAVAIAVALLSGSQIAFLFVNILGATMLALLAFAFAGWVTTFHYAVWVRFYELANVRGNTISKVHRIWKGR
jgi:hypothetical protein